MVNNWPSVYVRMYMEGGDVQSLAIMINNDVTQTKYVVYILNGIALSSTSIGDSLHIIIDNVTQNMGTTYKDVSMQEESTTITINDGSDLNAYGTWTSTIKPDNVTIELDCEVVENSSVITAKCGSIQWIDSMFNRIPISKTMKHTAQFGYMYTIHRAMFGTNDFQIKGSVPNVWSQYNVDRSGSSLIIGNQVTIMNLPESFVSYWVDTIHAKAYMGKERIMLVPPDSSQ